MEVEEAAAATEDAVRVLKGGAVGAAVLAVARAATAHTFSVALGASSPRGLGGGALRGGAAAHLSGDA